MKGSERVNLCWQEDVMRENIPVQITDAQFEQEVLKADGIVLVDF